jgi:hypothetical protein
MLKRNPSETQQNLKHKRLLPAFFVTLIILIPLTNFPVNTNAQEIKKHRNCRKFSSKSIR